MCSYRMGWTRSQSCCLCHDGARSLQVRVAMFAPIVALQTLVWLLVGVYSRHINPEHAGPPPTA